MNKKNRKRSLSRLMAIQIFYQHDFLADEKKLAEIKEDVIENYALDFDEDISSYRSKIDEDFLNNLILGFDLNREKLDAEITEFLKEGWNIERLDDISRQILRLGAFELKFMLDTPLKVVIDEYVDIAGSFFDDKKITFVNGTLENLAKKYRAAELEKIKNPTAKKPPHEPENKKVD